MGGEGTGSVVPVPKNMPIENREETAGLFSEINFVVFGSEY